MYIMGRETSKSSRYCKYYFGHYVLNRIRYCRNYSTSGSSRHWASTVWL